MAVSLAQWAFKEYGPTPISATRRTRMPLARVLCLLPRERARWRIRVRAHANTDCLLEAAAGTSEHGRAPRERAVSLAQGFRR